MTRLMVLVVLAAILASGCSTMEMIADGWSAGETRVTEHSFGGYVIRSED